MRSTSSEWEGKNPGWKVAPEVVGWEQCQDKATTLAAAGTPVAHGLCRLAHAEGIRAERPDRSGSDDRRGEEGLLSEHRRHGDLRRTSSGAFRSPSRPRRSTGTRTSSSRPASIRKRRRRPGPKKSRSPRQIKEKTGIPGYRPRRPRPSTTPCTSSCIGFTPTTARSSTDDKIVHRQPRSAGSAPGLQGHRALLRRRSDRLRAERSPRHLPRRQGRHDPGRLGCCRPPRRKPRSTGASRRCRSVPSAKGPGHAAHHRQPRGLQGHRRRGQGDRIRQVHHLAGVRRRIRTAGRRRPDAAASVAAGRRVRGQEDPTGSRSSTASPMVVRSRSSPTTRASRTS